MNRKICACRRSGRTCLTGGFTRLMSGFIWLKPGVTCAQGGRDWLTADRLWLMPGRVCLKGSGTQGVRSKFHAK